MIGTAEWLNGRAVLILPVNAPAYRALVTTYLRTAGGPIEIGGTIYSIESCDRHALDLACARVTLRLGEAVRQNQRQFIEAEIERLIGLLDRMDGDPDFEPDPIEDDGLDEPRDYDWRKRGNGGRVQGA